MDLLRIRIPSVIYRVAQLLEIVISLLVIAAIVLSLRTVAMQLGLIWEDPTGTTGLHNFLSTAFTVVIGVEFLKMLVRHNMSACIEVLLFAVARQMVIEHTSPMENLAMVAAIALLFAIRKFLFIPGLDDKQSMQENRTEESKVD